MKNDKFEFMRSRCSNLSCGLHIADIINAIRQWRQVQTNNLEFNLLFISLSNEFIKLILLREFSH